MVLVTRIHAFGRLTAAACLDPITSTNHSYNPVPHMQVMNIEKTRAAMARIEVYLGLIQQRVEQMKRDKEIPPELLEAVASISYAARRLESVPELEQLRKLFERKCAFVGIACVVKHGLRSSRMHSAMSDASLER